MGSFSKAVIPGLLCAWGIARAEEAGFAREEPKFHIQSAAVNEASGLAVSTRDAEFMWVVNDSGAKPILHLAGTEGSDRGQVAVRTPELDRRMRRVELAVARVGSAVVFAGLLVAGVLLRPTDDVLGWVLMGASALPLVHVVLGGRRR